MSRSATGCRSPESPKRESDFERFEDAGAFLGAIGATVRHGGDQAFHSPASDAITLPTFEQFVTPEHYYGTSLHEHGHWTGAKHRLAREFGKRFGEDAYAFEEFLLQIIGVGHLETNVKALGCARASTRASAA